MRQILFIMTLWISACGNNGSDTTSTSTPNPVLHTCKTIYSIWESDTDAEKWDLQNFETTSTASQYFFNGTDGTKCGYSPATGETMSALFGAPMSAQFYQYYINMQTNLSLNAFPACTKYVQLSSVGQLSASAFLIFDPNKCDQLTVCNPGATSGSDPINCKTFH